ncbi:hypothetical protein D0T12_05500 [Actinomadura spongiicola]|uniref:Uncharacterized protein n=1 Tax=Actinomadura spongiicola TaxID=2303421 RepID=A0A372GL28_9ACTN|nr:DUF6193 family natural product biosynthesis protein [Actinomadura spongiicola]RFS86087.1 hypothetical protein D0T12_05500 [Actinomadura spongiicola]
MAASHAEQDPGCEPDPASCGDLFDEGGLIGRLEEAAAAEGIDLGRLLPASASMRLSSASLRSERGVFKVISDPDARHFTFWVVSRDIRVLGGRSGELSLIARVMDEWRSGLALSRLGTRWKFVDVDMYADEREYGDLVAVHWREILEDADFADIRPLLVEAHAVPRLRNLYPVVSHDDLFFSRCTAPPYALIEPHARRRGEKFVVLGRGDDLLTETSSAQSAISYLASILPAGIGPAVIGDQSSVPDIE